MTNLPTTERPTEVLTRQVRRAVERRSAKRATSGAFKWNRAMIRATIYQHKRAVGSRRYPEVVAAYAA